MTIINITNRMKLRFLLPVATILLIMALSFIILLLMLSLPTLITFIPEHIEFAHDSSPIIAFFEERISAVFDLVLYCIILINSMLALQLFLLFSFVKKSKRENMICCKQEG